MIKIYQSFTKKEELSWINKKSIPMNYSGINGCEYDLFKIIEKENLNSNAFWGLASWKFSLKSQIAMDAFLDFSEERINNGADCVFINPMLGNEAIFATPWEQGYLCGHKGMDYIYQKLVSNNIIPHIEVQDKSEFSFCNYFVANNKFWTKYFSFVDYVIEFIELASQADQKLMSIYSGSANYSKNISLTMRPFIIERLFSTFIYKYASEFNIASFEFKSSNYHDKFGFFLGNYLVELSELKRFNVSEWNLLRKKIIGAQPMVTIMCMDDPSEDFIL
jgi:hypothetical protein